MNLKQCLEMQEKENYSLVAFKDNQIYTSKNRGIAPIMDALEKDLHYFDGYVVCDKVIGKAAAMLFTYSGIHYIHARTLSKGAQEILDKYHVEYSYDTLTEYIINREGNDLCPMEKTVLEINDLQEAYIALKNKLSELRGM